MAVNSAVAASARAAPRRRARRARGRTRWAGWAFVGPFLVVFAFALIVPIGYAIYLSLFREQLIGGNAFVGLSNYRLALSDRTFAARELARFRWRIKALGPLKTGSLCKDLR